MSGSRYGDRSKAYVGKVRRGMEQEVLGARGKKKKLFQRRQMAAADRKVSTAKKKKDQSGRERGGSRGRNGGKTEQRCPS